MLSHSRNLDFFLQKCFSSSRLQIISIFSKSLNLIGCHGNIKGKFSKKYPKILPLEAVWGNEAETLHTCSWQLKLILHILLMGKVEIGIYFCVTAVILTKVLLKCFWMHFVQITDFDWRLKG